MTKREEYGLKFIVIKHPIDGSFVAKCTRPEVGVFSHLVGVNIISICEVDDIILQIDLATAGKWFENSPLIDGFDVLIDPPRVTISETLTMPMMDFRTFLVEWKDFVFSVRNGETPVSS